MRHRLQVSALALALVAAPGWAQDLGCAGLDPLKEGHGTVAFRCIGTLQAALDAAMAKIDALSAKVEDLKDAEALADATRPGSALALPAGAVVMFAQNFTGDETEPCPVGWSLYQPATGRMPIGAGQPSLKQSTEFIEEFGQYDIWDPAQGKMVPTYLRPHVRDANNVWQYYRLEEHGGAEKVVLSEGEMPAHDHGGSTRTEDRSGGKIWYDTGLASETWKARTDGSVAINRDKTHAHPIELEGGGNPHNNMPPYIALFFCKKGE